jgi:hypothetical protein
MSENTKLPTIQKSDIKVKLVNVSLAKQQEQMFDLFLQK